MQLEIGLGIGFQKVRVYFKDKYKVECAFLFIGYVPGNEAMYTKLQKAGYIVIFKTTLEINGHIKGHVDAELVLHSMIEFQNYDKAIIVYGDGDFHCLIEYLLEQNKLERVLIPNRYKFSMLLTKFCPHFHYMNELKEKLAIKRRRVTKD